MSTARARSFAAAAACAIALAALSGVAAAKSRRVVSYPFREVWPTAIREIRIDEGDKILEKDAEGGYIIFQVAEEHRHFRGTLELVRTKDDEGRAAVLLIINIADRPSYMEQGILDRLAQKLHDEHGDPPPPAHKQGPKRTHHRPKQ